MAETHVLIGSSSNNPRIDPVAAIGTSAPPGKTIGHTGAIISGAAGVVVAESRSSKGIAGRWLNIFFQKKPQHIESLNNYVQRPDIA